MFTLMGPTACPSPTHSRSDFSGGRSANGPQKPPLTLTCAHALGSGVPRFGENILRFASVSWACIAVSRDACAGSEARLVYSDGSDITSKRHPPRPQSTTVTQSVSVALGTCGPDQQDPFCIPVRSLNPSVTMQRSSTWKLVRGEESTAPDR
jgi:hypothetical protein